MRTLIKTLALALACQLLAACSAIQANPGQVEQPGGVANAAARQDPVHNFLSSAEDGAARALVDPNSGAVTEVTAGRAYFAASGRTCKQYSVLRRPEPRQDMIACQLENGSWRSSPSLINPGLPNGQPNS